LTQEQVFGGPHTVKLCQTELIVQFFGPQFTVTPHVGKGNKFCLAGLGEEHQNKKTLTRKDVGKKDYI